MLSFLLGPNSATWFSFGIRGLSQLGMPLLIVFYFDVELLAVWLVLMTLQGLQLLFSSGIGQPTLRAFSYAAAGALDLKDHRFAGGASSRFVGPNIVLLNQVWSASFFMHFAVALFTVLVLGSWGLVTIDAMSWNRNLSSEVWGALAIFIAGAGVRCFGGLHYAYLFGMNQHSVARFSEAFFFLLSFALGSFLLVMGWGILAVAIGVQLPTMIMIFWNSFLCHRHQLKNSWIICLSWLTVGNVITQLWPAMWQTTLGVSVFLLATQGAGLIYARFGEPAEVASYLFAMSLVRPLYQFAQVPFSTKLSVLARLQVTGDLKNQVLIARKCMRTSNLVHVALVFAFAFLLPSLSILRSDGFSVPIMLWLLIGLASYFENVASMHIQFYSVTNRVRVHIANGLTAVVFCVGALLLFELFGQYALPLALIFAMVFVFVPIAFYYSYPYFGLNFPRFEFQTSLFPLLLLLIVIGVVCIR